MMRFAAAKNTICSVRFEHSFGEGLFVRLPKTTVTRQLVARLEREMREIVEADMPIPMTACTKEEANAYFAETGQTDKLRLLRYRSFENFRFYELEGLKE